MCENSFTPPVNNLGVDIIGILLADQSDSNLAMQFQRKRNHVNFCSAPNEDVQSLFLRRHSLLAIPRRGSQIDEAPLLAFGWLF